MRLNAEQRRIRKQLGELSPEKTELLVKKTLKNARRMLMELGRELGKPGETYVAAVWLMEFDSMLRGLKEVQRLMKKMTEAA